MPIKKKKISELTLADNLKGLYTIGVKLINGVQTSVKVSLEYIQTAYENAVSAAQKALEAATKANNAAGSANSAASSANSAATKANTAAGNADKATVSANTATTNANNAATKANKAAGNADTQADRAKEHADNPPKMGENGNWWKWDESKKMYVDTGILAKGGVLYPSFEILDDDMCLYMSYQDDIAADQFELDADGCLNFKFK